MRLRDLPIISDVINAGPDEQVFNSLLLFGPLIIGLIAVFDRSSITEALAVMYIAVFVTYVLYRGVQEY